MEEPRELLPLKVTVAGEAYQVRTDLSPEELEAVSNYISEKIKIHIVPNARTEPRKQLVLMSMEITSELFAARRRIAELENSLGETARRASRIVAAFDQIEDDDASIEELTPRRDGFPGL